MTKPDYPKLAAEAIERSKKDKAERTKAFDKDFGDPVELDDIAAIEPEKAHVPVLVGPWREYLRETKDSPACPRTHADLMKGVRNSLADSDEVVVQACCILKCQPASKPKAPAK